MEKSPMQLIIKAESLEDAKKFALMRRITITNGDVMKRSPREVICEVDDSYRNRAIVWFCEDASKAPYPMGTLLWHN
jgi:phage-related baseplate assembly protein